MAQFDMVEEREPNTGAKIAAFFVRILVAVLIPLIAFAVLYAGFIFLRDSDAPKWAIVLIAIIWGVGGVAVLYWVFNGIVEKLPGAWTIRLQPLPRIPLHRFF